MNMKRIRAAAALQEIAAPAASMWPFGATAFSSSQLPMHEFRARSLVTCIKGSEHFTILHRNDPEEISLCIGECDAPLNPGEAA